MENIYTQSNLAHLLARHRRILLLQGPVGPFFNTLAAWLRRHGKTVCKLNFNGGDEHFYPAGTPDTFAYRGTLAAFPDFLADFAREHHIDAVVCFGDTRPYHAAAKQAAQTLGLGFWAFEEGYFRPFYITLEQNGVNAFSPLPREAAFFRCAYARLPEKKLRPQPAVKGGFMPMAQCAATYYLAASAARRRYPHYIHHRSSSLHHYLHAWAVSGIRRATHYLQDRRFGHAVEQGRYGRFYILPLQVFNDSQVRVHSSFESVTDFLLHVLASFAEHAPDDTSLVVKHHPMDRGFTDYRHTIAQFLQQHPALKNRIFYVHDTPLPVLLRHGTGMVTLNSTSGLSALIHNMPVKVLGRAHYDINGITHQGSLAGFWHNPTPPDAVLFHAYRMYHLNVTQIDGSFYSQVHLPEIVPHLPARASAGRSILSPDTIAQGRLNSLTAAPMYKTGHHEW